MSSDFSKFRTQLKLVGELELLTPLRIGAGDVNDIASADLTVIKDALDRPYIPGSSFKGALRSHVESVLRSIDDSKDRNLACLCVTERRGEADGCLTTRDRKKREKQFEKHEQDLDAFVFDNSCQVCRVFGSPWLASKVLIADLTLADPDSWLERYQVRDGVAIDRDTETAAEGFLYSYEVVSAGTRFRLELTIENASEAEQGMVLMGLRGFEFGRLPLGGGTSRGLGRVKLEWNWDACGEIDSEDKAALVDYLLSNKMAGLNPEKVQAKLTKFRESLGV